MFQQSPKDIDAKCIERVIEDAWQESGVLEFKESLPCKSGDDRWIKKGDGIGDYARNVLLAEIIAFANAFGGWLVIGIQETETKPARAKGVNPIPKCADLAERIRLQCRDCIEPQIQLIEIEGIPVEADGSGVVIIYVPRSRMAPHRHKITKECYFRHADRSEPMTMREIQDLTLQVERGQAAIERQFEKRKTDFLKQFTEFDAKAANSFGIRATLIPQTKIGVPAVHGIEKLKPPVSHFACFIGGRGPHDIFLPDTPMNWRPIIRGTIADDKDTSYTNSRELHCNGLIEYKLFERAPPKGTHIIPVVWMLAILLNSLCAVEIFRRAAGAPNVEYGLEIEILFKQAQLRVGPYHGGVEQFFGKLKKGAVDFPRYSVGPKEEFQELTQIFETDFWHGAGRPMYDRIAVDFETIFDQLGLE